MVADEEEQVVAVVLVATEVEEAVDSSLEVVAEIVVDSE